MKLPRLLVDNKRPFPGSRKRPNAVASGGKFQIAHLKIGAAFPVMGVRPIIVNSIQLGRLPRIAFQMKF